MEETIESLRQQVADFRATSSGQDTQRYVSLFVMKHPELMVEELETLQYEVTLALGGLARKADVEEVQQWLAERSVHANLETAEGWLIAAGAMWDQWSCTNNVGRHIVGRIVVNASKAGIFIPDLLKTAKG